MRFSVLGSGSAGNSTLLECGNTRILIDAGLSAKQIALRLISIGIHPDSLTAILLTHEHGDHTRGLKNFIKKHPVPLYATAETAHVLRESCSPCTTWNTFDAGQNFKITHLGIHSFPVQHDAIDPVGFTISNEECRLGFLSDLGFVTSGVKQKLKNLTALFIEANYDDDLLMADTKRPWVIKQRISSRHGHLSNAQVETLLREIAHPDLTQIVFGHLSSDCNCPKKVKAIFTEVLRDVGTPHTALYCASQTTPTPWFHLAHPFRLI